MTALDVRELDVFFGTTIGLRALQFDVDAGACLAVLGASGSGKSSLLRTLAGLQPAAAGRFAVADRDVTALPPEHRSVVYLHQEPVLFPHRTVLANVTFPLDIRGVSATETKRRAMTWLERLQVGELGGRRPSSLSGGQRHRVALARALCADPAALLLDEPLAALDPATRQDVRRALVAVREASQAAMVLVTHDLDDALAIGTRIMTLGGGRQTAIGAPADLLDAPPSLEVARLLGVFSEIDGVVEQTPAGARFRWAAGTVPVDAGYSAGAVACVRSAEVSIAPSASGDVTVVAMHHGAHDVAVTLRGPDGTAATVRTLGAPGVQPGDRVAVTVHRLRLFPAG